MKVKNIIYFVYDRTLALPSFQRMFSRYFAVAGIAVVTMVGVMGCGVALERSESKSYSTDEQVFFAQSIRGDVGRIADYCELKGDFERQENPPYYDIERLETASIGLESALADGTPWLSMEAQFYTTVGLDIINSYAADGCDLAQFLVTQNASVYEWLWGEDYLAASEIHDTVHVRPTPDPTHFHELLKPDPIITTLEEQTVQLDQCAAKHGNSDYTAAAAAIRAMLAITQHHPDTEEKRLLTFQMENANMMLANC